MTNEEMKKVAIKTSVFAAVSMILLLHRSATKHIMITDAARAPVDRGEVESTYSLLVDGNVPTGKENTLIIPLPGGVSSDNIILEDRYTDHELSIYIDSHDSGFYMDNPIVTDLDILESAVCNKQDGTGNVSLDFTLDGLYANESTLTDSSTIEVKFYAPSEKYQHVAVVDAGGGGSDPGKSSGGLLEKNITLQTALLLKEIADEDTENDVKIYFTRLGDTDVDPEKRIALVNDSGADLVVKLSVDSSEDRNVNGTSSYYNDRFFLRNMSNAQLSDIVLKSCASKGSAAPIGVFAASEEDEFISGCKVAATKLNLGVVSGKEDASRLSDEAYLKRLAEGVYSGIISSFEVME